MRVYKLVQRAIEEGRLTRADSCEVCNRDVSLVAHHWHGYSDEHATNVWWICHKCNTALRGTEYHNGSVTLEQAREVVRQKIVK